MIIIRALAFLLLFTVIPFAVGRLITYRARKGLIVDYLVGFFGNLGIFYILYSIITWIQIWITFVWPVTGAFTILLRFYFAVMSLLIILWLILDRKAIFHPFKKMKPRIKDLGARVKADKLTVVYALAFAAVLFIQMYMAYGYEINEWSYDDYDYVVSSQDTISSDTLSYVNIIDGSMPAVAEKRAVSSWNTYIAMLAKVSSFEVTTVCHTILPVLFIALAYLVYFYIARFLFAKTEDRMIFMLILSFAYIFGLYSHYSVSFRLLGAVWQGKAVLTVIAVPFFAMYLFSAYCGKLRNGLILPIIAVSLGASSLTSLATVFIPIVAVIVWVSMCVYHRRIYGIRYLIASLVGPAFLGIYYSLIWMLQHDMSGSEDKYFPFRKSNEWWFKWFKENI
ncbi:DUF6077 domain-containing protein [Pseudobutyrivibrio xylanivorans]|uniref:Uncharacterized protein n=1 Tax=Pseudobutyrivibrio xylanivorans DSM 14809 TaxID=1123012 RepID=A0A1M6GVY4_PSEXY|nr:DUF6077 domain-containing protein [Pseudobutyrivibrio xylanivorans]SHJ14111.1 hypothetical protein SAMN02745725_01844 [Pseudobutyrivibrio xylanivorans DSM 14809]